MDIRAGLVFEPCTLWSTVRWLTHDTTASLLWNNLWASNGPEGTKSYSSCSLPTVNQGHTTDKSSVYSATHVYLKMFYHECTQGEAKLNHRFCSSHSISRIMAGCLCFSFITPYRNSCYVYIGLARQVQKLKMKKTRSYQVKNHFHLNWRAD